MNSNELELEMIMTGKSLIPCLPNIQRRKIKENCYELITPFLDFHNDYIMIYVTYLDGKLVMVDEDTVPNLIAYSSDDVANIIRKYISEQTEKKCHLTVNELVYDLDQTQNFCDFTHYLENSYYSFISYILETMGVAKLFSARNS